MKSRHSQHGATLIITLIMLLIIGVVSIGAVRALVSDEKTAGAAREKQRALAMAISAQTYAERWLKDNAGGGALCTAQLGIADAPQICTNELVDPAATVWADAAGNPMGKLYNPGNITVTSDAASIGPATFYDYPRFNIQRIGGDPTGSYSIYRIVAMSYGARPGTVSVVSSTFRISFQARAV